MSDQKLLGSHQRSWVWGRRAVREILRTNQDAARDAGGLLAPWPVVQLTVEALDRHEVKIPNPAVQILPKFLVATLHRHAAFATRNLFHSILELLDILRT